MSQNPTPSSPVRRYVLLAIKLSVSIIPLVVACSGVRGARLGADARPRAHVPPPCASPLRPPKQRIDRGREPRIEIGPDGWPTEYGVSMINIDDIKRLEIKPGETLVVPDRAGRVVCVAPVAMFVYCLVVKLAILDGRRGLLYAGQRAVAETILSVFLLQGILIRRHD